MKKKAVAAARRAVPAPVKATVKTKSDGLAPLVAEVRSLIQSARRGAASFVHTLQVMTNFEIGRRIVEHEQKGSERAAYGAELLKELSARLTQAIVSTAFAVLYPRPSLDARYLFYWLRSQSFQDEVTERMKGVAYPAISDSDLWRCQIPLPPVTEQKQILEKVGELMALCDQLESEQQERESRHTVLARAALARFADAPTTANLQWLFHSSYAISPADLRKSILTLAVQGRLVGRS